MFGRMLSAVTASGKTFIKGTGEVAVKYAQAYAFIVTVNFGARVAEKVGGFVVRKTQEAWTKYRPAQAPAQAQATA